MYHWAAQFDSRHVEQLVSLSIELGVEPLALVDGDIVWLKGVAKDTDAQAIERQLATWAVRRFRVLGDKLVRIGDRVPTDMLPGDDEGWRPVSQLLSLRLPVAKIAQGSATRVKVKLERHGDRDKANAVRSTIWDLAEYVESAPMVRLEPFRFAMNDLGHVLIVPHSDGNRSTESNRIPLPAIKGTLFVESQRIAVPLGCRWSPMLSSSCIRQAYDVPHDSLLVLYEDSLWDTIAHEDWVQLTRSAVRFSQQAFAEKKSQPNE